MYNTRPPSWIDHRSYTHVTLDSSFWAATGKVDLHITQIYNFGSCYRQKVLLYTAHTTSRYFDDEILYPSGELSSSKCVSPLGACWLAGIEGALQTTTYCTYISVVLLLPRHHGRVPVCPEELAYGVEDGFLAVLHCPHTTHMHTRRPREQLRGGRVFVCWSGWSPPKISFSERAITEWCGSPTNSDAARFVSVPLCKHSFGGLLFERYLASV